MIAYFLVLGSLVYFPIARGQKHIQSQGFSIYKGFSNSSENQWLLYRNTNGPGYNYTIPLNPPVALQHLEVSKNRVMTICEFKLVEGECQDGTFGQNCTLICHCKDNDPCDPVTGGCPNNDCAPGWKDFDCNTECDDGTFGQDCQNHCYCLNQVPCNKVNGICPSGLCDKGWIGITCSQECYDGTFGVNCSSICHCKDNVTCNPVTGGCPNNDCAPGWQGVDCNTECDDGTFGQDCQSHCHCLNQEPCNKINGICPSGLCDKGWIGITCSQECHDGTFGLNCSSICHCKDNVPCDPVTGVCPNNDCAPGWQGVDCNAECDDGTFGQDCQSHCHCQNQEPCNKVNGICPFGLCDKGWIGITCSQECSDGLFGQNCTLTCHCQNNVTCDPVEGKCPNDFCAPGWKDTDCNTECDDRTFGLNCESACHCQNFEVCEKIEGSCRSGLCAKGWRGASCSIECHDGSFGQNCSSICHCLENATCDHITGKCPDGSCVPGWTGIACNTATVNQRMDETSSTGVITGTVIAVVIIAVIVTAVIIYWRRKRNRKCASSSPHPLSTSNKLRTDIKAEHTYTNTTVVYEKDITVDEPEHIYDGIASTDDGIPVKELWNIMKSVYGNGFAKIHEEFQAMLQRGPESAHPAKKKGTKKTACNERKVVLREDGNPVLTMLDAKYVDGYGGHDKFVVTQGPSGETVNEFWEMVYQENTTLIIMLEGPLDHKKTQHVQYWPSEGKSVYGRITIKKIKFTTYSDHIIRKFVISKQNAEQRHITQMQFTGWPDDSVPDIAWQFVQFWRKSVLVVEKERGPVFVHGCISGSMGSYIALDTLFKQARTEELIRPQDTIKELFKQSGDLIQTKEQYGFIHEAIAEALFVRAKPIKQKDFEEIFMSMSKEDTQLGKSGLAKQYEIMFPSDTTYTGLQQRASDHVYSDLTTSGGDNPQRSVPFVSMTPRNPPNTITLKNYAQQDAFILTTSNDSLAEELWILIETRKMKTVIRFQSDKEDLRIDQGCQAKYSIQLLESKRDNNIVINSYAYKRKDSVKAEVKSVKEFVYLGWQTGEPLPSDVQSVIVFICTVQQWQPSINENHPVLLCCRPGVKKAELCFALLNEFDRLRSTGEVNLLETVKCMVEKDDQLVPSFDQYEFCHAVVLEYIKDYDAYENV